MPQVELVLAIGHYAQRWHIGPDCPKSMTETVVGWRRYAMRNAVPAILPLPHPSWRNTGWLKRNPWFEAEVLPFLRERVESVDCPETNILYLCRFRAIERKIIREGHSMDRLDRKILRLLQEDSTLAVADLAKKVGLSTTPCWRRIQKMEEDGVIRRRVALLDPVKVNTKVTVFVSIRTNTHSIEWLRRFSEVVGEFPEVVEFYRMSGDVDYLLRVVVPDIAAYDAFYKRLIAKIEIRDVSSAFAMEQIKYTTAASARLHDDRSGEIQRGLRLGKRAAENAA